jgi:RNA polymerase sigma-70 factor (ECF subfamily)
MTESENTLNPESWVEKHGDYLYRYALGRSHNPTEAEEAVQNTFLSAWQNREKFAGNATERTWLTSILKNKINDRFRIQIKDREKFDDSVDVSELDSLFDETGHGNIPSVEWTGDPAEAAENADFWAVFDDCASKLPKRTVSVFTMREVDQMTSKEICKVLDITPSNYWVRLHRARLKLRECLQFNWFQDQGVNS